MNKSKTLQELNLIDAFLFSASTENPKNAELIAKLIIERATGRKVKEISVVPEKQLLGIDIRQHGIRMDLYITEYETNNIVKVYDIEPNKYDINELPKRSRYNQAITDVKLLGAGQRYKNLPEYISIWILTEDPFGKNRMIYTVRNCVEEDSRIVYNDGVKKLFLYVGGKIGGSENLKNLLQYFSKSNESNVVDDDIKALHEVVENVRNNQEVGEHFMTLQEYLEYEIKEGIEEGIEERIKERLEEETEKVREKCMKEGREAGLKEGIKEGIKEGLKEGGIASLIKSYKKFGASDEQIIQSLVEEYELSKDEAETYLCKQ